MLFVRVGGLVVEEGVHFGDGGGKASEVEGEAAEERSAAGLLAGGEGFLIELGKDEAVDGVADPSCLGDCGEVRALGRDEGPVFFDFDDFAGEGIGPIGPFVDPAADDFNLRGGEGLTAHGHAGLVAGAGDALKEQGILGVARLDGDARDAAREGGGFGVEAEAAELLGGAVAAGAGAAEDGLDVRSEVDFRWWWWVLRGVCCPESSQEEREK